MKEDVIRELKKKYSINRNKDSKELCHRLVNDERYVLFSNNVYVNLSIHAFLSLQVWSDFAGIYHTLTNGGALFLDIIKVVLYPVTVWF